MEEMDFLGMRKRTLTEEEAKLDPVKIAEQKRLERKNVQEGNWKSYLSVKKNVKEEIDKI